jgi:class 3 adenylate cyclase
MRAETTARGVCAALLRATRAELRLSRAVVLETEDDMGTFRVLGVEGADDATFASRTVVADARRSGVALHVAKFGDAAASIAASGAGSAAAAAVRSKAGKSRVLYGDRPAGEPALAWVDALTIQVLVAHAASILDGLSHQHEIAAQRLQFEQLRRYFSPAVIQHLLAQDEGAILKPQQLHVTVLFADLTGYTAIAERMAGRADALFALLNRWLDAGARAVLGQGGTLDKFIGDAVMAVFGAPYPLPQAVQRAARCALEMRGALETIGLELGERLALTVGIHSGPVLAGSVGSQRRLEYTVLGDTVNVSARLQGLAKPGEILLSEDAAREIGNDAELVGVGPLQLKNRQHAVQTFRLVALRV